MLQQQDTEVRKYVSESIGNKTVKSRSRSHNLNQLDMGIASMREEGIRLLLPEHMGRLEENKLVLLREDKMPVIANKIRYFEDPYFMDLADVDKSKISDLNMPANLVTPDKIYVPEPDFDEAHTIKDVEVVKQLRACCSHYDSRS